MLKNKFEIVNDRDYNMTKLLHDKKQNEITYWKDLSLTSDNIELFLEVQFLTLRISAIVPAKYFLRLLCGKGESNQTFRWWEIDEFQILVKWYIFNQIKNICICIFLVLSILLIIFTKQIKNISTHSSYISVFVVSCYACITSLHKLFESNNFFLSTPQHQI